MDLRHLVGALAQVERLAIGQAERLDRLGLVQGRRPQSLEHPAAVFESALVEILGLALRVEQERGQQLGQRQVTGDRDLEGGVGSAHDQAAQIGGDDVRHRSSSLDDGDWAGLRAWINTPVEGTRPGAPFLCGTAGDGAPDREMLG